MKVLAPILFLILGASLLPASEMPWIGVFFKRAEDGERKGTPLPKGVGFRVAEVVPDSPLASVDGRAGDLWWKFDGQILINKSQMVVLLRSKKAGSQSRIDFYRDGKLKSLMVTLGTRPEKIQRKPDDSKLIAAKRDGSTVSRRFTKREKVARVSVAGLDYALHESTEGRHFKVSKGEELLFDRPLEKGNFTKDVPGQYLDSLHILHLTLVGMKSGPESDTRKDQED